MIASAAAKRLREAAAERVLLTDGAFGTMIQSYRLTEADYRGPLDLTDDQKGNNDLLVLTRPDVIDAITRAYLDAGSDIVSTNTFNANTISQGDYNAVRLVRDMNLAAARIARIAADDYERRDGRPRFVAGAIGPTNKTLSLSPDVNDPGYRAVGFDEVKDVYADQAAALLDGGRLHPDRDDLRHAQCQGGNRCCYGARRNKGLRNPADDLDDDHRYVRAQPVGPFGRGVLVYGAPRPAADHRSQLRVRG